ncbi:MFS transporter [Pseudonocardia alaniniphila]|uniref:MFS transporter n=1 Tax=Pseudonocardia alaniniphila TaxID=75291 RepID=UPI002402D1C1|nr:MFS transporter [Pseudonocardia alaniniphila]
MSSTSPSTETVPPTPGSAWAPFRHRAFAGMWSAQFVSNVGGWMQTVGAQWLMLMLTGSATYVALVQTASSLPVMLFAVFAGAIGDVVDRRRFLLVSQAFMLLAAAALGVLALAGLVTPWLLLALIFAVGSGGAMTASTWQTLQPELVSPAERPQAISLGAVNQNLARAVGPAIGGIVLAASSAGTLFLINAVTFVAVIGVIAWWRGDKPSTHVLPREHVGEAIRAGARYVMASPTLRVILLRAGLFIFFASLIWALLPLVAQSELRLGSGGYGLLLACVGVGAVVGAAVLPHLLLRTSAGFLLAAASFGLAAVAIVLAYVPLVAPVAVALVIGGFAWILALSVLNSAYQLMLPDWAKSRGMAYYLVVFQGGNAVGSAILGVVAQRLGFSSTLLVVAVGLVLGALVELRHRFQTIPPEELVSADEWSQPTLTTAALPGGPVMVTIEYRPCDGADAELLAALRDVRFSRRRSGATSWRVWQDAAEPHRIVEQFVVASWEEHLRQHERVSERDQKRLARIWAMTDPDRPPTVTHWLAAQPGRTAR